MLTDNHQWVVELLNPDDFTSLGQFPVKPDWEPAREWLYLTALRRLRSNTLPATAPVVIEPVWHTEAGRPYVSGASLRLSANGEGPVACQIPVRYFQALAQATAIDLVANKTLEAGTLYQFAVSAFPRVEIAPLKNVERFRLEEEAPVMEFRRSSRDQFSGRAVAFGAQYADDVPVFIPQSVLDEAAAQTRRADRVETGGVLVGYLHRDSAAHDIFVEVTAQLPAQHTRSELAQLRFTADTWKAARDLIALRRRGEVMVGFWHSHPGKYFCGTDCPPEKRKNCPLQKPFFSPEDLALFRAVFPRAFSLALVVTNADAGLVHTLFGWRDALLVERGFQILKEGET